MGGSRGADANRWDGRAAERAFLAGVTVVFVLACTVPYALAEARTPPDARFSGVLLRSFDHHYYLAAQRSVAEGLARRNRFTSEPGAPGPIAPLYPLLGLVERQTGLPPMLAYHLPRVLAAVALPWLLLRLFGLCFPERRDRARWAVLLCLFASGPLTLAPSLSVAGRSGERITESNALFALGVFPHFAVAYCGLVLAFTAVAMALRDRHPARIAGAAGAAGLLLAVSHPFLLVPVGVVLAVLLTATLARRALLAVSGPAAGRLLAAAAVFLPAAPFLADLRAEQDRLERLQGFPFPSAAADAWWTWAVGYGVVSVLAVAGLVRVVRRERADPGSWMLLVWAGAQFALIYWTGTVFQRRFSEALIVPVAGVAATGMTSAGGAGPVGRLLRGTVLVFLALGAYQVPNILGHSGEHLPRAYAEVLRLVGSEDVVVAGKPVSSSLPAYSPGTAYAARPVETLHNAEKRRQVDRYARDPASGASRRWLGEAGVTLVVVQDGDRTFVPQGPDDPATCLRSVFRRGGLAAYRVDRACLPAP